MSIAVEDEQQPVDELTVTLDAETIGQLSALIGQCAGKTLCPGSLALWDKLSEFDQCVYLVDIKDGSICLERS